MDCQKNVKEKRLFNDRRKFSYTAHSPERRTGTDRRGIDSNKLKARVA